MMMVGVARACLLRFSCSEWKNTSTCALLSHHTCKNVSKSLLLSSECAIVFLQRTIAHDSLMVSQNSTLERYTTGTPWCATGHLLWWRGRDSIDERWNGVQVACEGGASTWTRSLSVSFCDWWIGIDGTSRFYLYSLQHIGIDCIEEGKRNKGTTYVPTRFIHVKSKQLLAMDSCRDDWLWIGETNQLCHYFSYEMRITTHYGCRNSIILSASTIWLDALRNYVWDTTIICLCHVWTECLHVVSDFASELKVLCWALAQQLQKTEVFKTPFAAELVLRCNAECGHTLYYNWRSQVPSFAYKYVKTIDWSTYQVNNNSIHYLR